MKNLKHKEKQTTVYSKKKTVCWGQDKVEQPSRQMTANEAAQVTLLCNYTTSYPTAYLFWSVAAPGFFGLNSSEGVLKN